MKQPARPTPALNKLGYFFDSQNFLHLHTSCAQSFVSKEQIRQKVCLITQ